MAEIMDLTRMNTPEKPDSDPNAAIVIQMPIVDEAKPKVTVRVVPTRKETKTYEEPTLQSMKDNIERAKILKDADEYMKKYAKANNWIMGIRLVIAVAVLTFMVCCTCSCEQIH